MVYVKNIIDGKDVVVSNTTLDIGRVENNRSYFEIFINPDAISRLGIDKDYVIWHEVFHILYNHFNTRKENMKIWNIACDMVINQVIGLTFPPFIYPGRYNLPTDLTEEEYYDILIKMQDEKDNPSNDGDSSDENGSSNEDNSSTKSESEDQDNNEEGDSDQVGNDDDTDSTEDSSLDEDNEPSEDKSKDNKSEDWDDNETSDEFDMSDFEDIIKDIDNNKVYFNSTHMDFEKSGDISVPIEKINEIKKEVFQKVPPIYRNLIKEVTSTFQKRIELVPTTYQSSYMKLNNRRNSGDILLPGRKKVTGGRKRNFNYSPVVFIDVSSSTSWDSITSAGRGITTINDALNCIASELHRRYGAKIIFYNSRIVKVINPKDKFMGCGAAGSTNITEAVEQAKHLGLVSDGDIILVITDGADSFDSIVANYKHLIYEVDKDSVEVISKDVKF